jgi:2-polyprenyl-3-methyl-5-hydroxy-6-metoxy-1,4-benzoquinol methylase
MTSLWEEVPVCGICDSTAWRPAGTVCQRRLAVCLECGVRRLYDRVAENSLGLLYADYYPVTDPSPAELKVQLRNPTFHHREARLASTIGSREHRILELGCGDGNFLAVMRHAGWRVVGSEFSANTAALVQRRHGVPVFVGNIADGTPPESPFPVVAAYHVLEHAYYPARWLRRVRELIEPNGLLHIQVPNDASFTHLMAGDAWSSVVFPQHVYFYRPATLTALLTREGFNILNMTTWDPWHGPGQLAHSVKNVARRVATGRLPWTDQLDARGPMVMASEANPRSSLLRTVPSAIIDGVAAPLARVEAALGHGAVVDIVAARRESA